MQSNNKIYSFFIVLALLFWNPLSYYLFFKNTPIINLKELQLLFWIIFILGIISIIIIQKFKVSELLKNITLVFAVIGILYAFLVTLDRSYGLIKNDNIDSANSQWLIFEPNTSARYKTFEFDYTANINNIGLRDNEVAINKENSFRVLCFGDSWTYGYGVNLEESWPKVLETELIKYGIDSIEIINCARPGQFTGTYKNYIEKIVPLLKPDIVIVGVLQLDDLAQVYTNHFLINNTGTISTLVRKSLSVLTRYFKYSFINFLPTDRIIEVTKNWEKENKSMIKNFNQWQKLRFSTLRDDVQDYFSTGNIEPSLLNYYINYPDRNIIFNDPDHPKTKFAIKGMNEDIKNIKTICDENESQLVFINIPINYFTGHIVHRTPSDYANTFLMENNNIDKIYRDISESNNVPYIELTEHFIQLPNKMDYLYQYDGHPNKNGYAEIAYYISDQLIEMDLLPK